MNEYLQETRFLDFNAEPIISFCQDISQVDKKEIAVALYLKVRDGFLYDPYHLDLRPKALVASQIVSKKRAWCVEKSILLAACARFFGIPSRLGFAIVSNHIGVEKLVHYLRKEEIVFHGYVEMYLNGKWVKCTPAFDKRICRVSKVTSLDWDGVSDSMFQEYDLGRKFMTYHHFYGEFNDVPVQLMNDEMKKHYPHLFEEVFNSKEFSFFHF